MHQAELTYAKAMLIPANFLAMSLLSGLEYQIGSKDSSDIQIFTRNCLFKKSLKRKG